MQLMSTWRVGDGPLAERLAAELRRQIATGLIVPGSALPSERSIVAFAGVSRSTANAAIDALVATRWAIRRDRARPVASLPDGRSQSIAPERRGSGGVDLIGARVAAPSERFDDAVERARSRLTPHLLGDGRQPLGLHELREAVAARFTATGLVTTADQVVITNGAVGAFNSVLDAVPGTVLVEDPSYHVALRLLARRRRRVVPWLRAEQWDDARLRDVVRTHRPRLAYLVPDFHNPTGANASDAERDAVAGTLAQVDTVVADETLRDLVLDGAADRLPEHLASFVPHAVTVGGLSKSVWSGLRVGWLRVTDRERRSHLGWFADNQPVPLFDQLVALELWPFVDGIVGERVERLRLQRDALIEQVRDHGFTVVAPTGGLVVWVDLGRPVARRLAAQLDLVGGPSIAPGEMFSLSAGHERFVRIPFTHDIATATTAIDELAAACARI